MGLFGRRRKGGVRGTARVISTSPLPGSPYGSLAMDVVIEAPGVPICSHLYKELGAPADKWPSPGDLLPVDVDPADPSRVKVLWDDLDPD